MEDDEVSPGLEDSIVVDKYKTAAKVANEVMAAIIAQVKVGAKVVELCQFGDKTIVERAAQHYGKKKQMLKGIAFPTCLSVNNLVGHFCPANADDKTTLQEGDLVKIDFGVHFDGYVSCMAHTVVATDKPTEVVGGKAADVVCAAYFAAEAALRLLRPGNTNEEVTKLLSVVAKDFGVNVVDGSFSHQLHRFVLDADEAIAGRDNPEQKVDLLKFEELQAWSLDVVMSTGDGKVKQSEHRSTVYKRTEERYNLKQASSRELQSHVRKTSDSLAWSVRSAKEAVGSKALLAIKEMAAHNMVFEYPVMQERPKELVAQFKFTVLIMPSKTEKLNSAPLPYVSSDKKVEDAEAVRVLALPLGPGKKKRKNKSDKAPELVEDK